MPNEVLPTQLIKNLLSNNWNTQGGLAPTPTFRDVGEPGQAIRVDMRPGDQIIIRMDITGTAEEPIGNWTYGNRYVDIELKFYTMTSRQRLHNLMQEARRVCHSNMHAAGINPFHRLRYKNFAELTQEQANIWEGRMTVRLESFGILLEV
ncbi:hypothetical protein HYS94_01535 [Candidatus Daviesbacteria bacterium]|nr:hypothetical protein [Candidatus Daviesbacteria bacterium]